MGDRRVAVTEQVNCFSLWGTDSYHPLGIPWAPEEGEGSCTSKLPFGAVICKLNSCCRDESALETYVTGNLWFNFFFFTVLPLVFYFITGFMKNAVLAIQMMWNFTANVALFPCHEQLFSFLTMELSCSVGMKCHFQNWRSAFCCTKAWKRSVLFAQSVLHWRNVPQSRVRWLRGFSFTFSGAICCFAFSVCQSTLKEGNDFQWFLYSLYQMLHPQLLFIGAHGYPDLELSVGNWLWVVKVFLYCSFVQSLTC